MKFKLILLALIIAFCARGQETIKGLVYDKTGPTPGVIVSEIGTDNKVITDAQGQFKIETTTIKPTLTFSFTGFQTKTIKIKKNKFLKVKMKWDSPKYKHISKKQQPPRLVCWQALYASS